MSDKRNPELPAKLGLSRTPPRSAFKQAAGSANHYLITILVGLSAVESGAASRPASFSTSWDPKDRVRSASRSRDFALKTTASWLAESLDAYLTALEKAADLRPASLGEDWQRLRSSDDAFSSMQLRYGGRTGRVQLAGRFARIENTAESLLAELCVLWRNRLVHRRSADLAPIARALHDADVVTVLGNEYQGLDPAQFIRQLEGESAKPPSFKEVTAMVRAAHRFVERVDAAVLDGVDCVGYFRSALRAYVHPDGTGRTDVLRRANNLWGKDPARQGTALVNIARNVGFAEGEGLTPMYLGRHDIEDLMFSSPRAALASLGIDVRNL